MPARHMAYPNGGPVLPVERGRPGSAPAALLLDAAYLRSFGEMRVPTHLWRAMRRFAAWVEPALIAEWARLMGDYARRQGGTLHCAWTGRALSAGTLDIDHLFPWSAWPCGDLWNLLPAHRAVNQRLKRDRLPSAAALERAGERIVGWWQTAYLSPVDPLLPERFGHDARASLPGLRPD